jgi:hypothetical protein
VCVRRARDALTLQIKDFLSNDVSACSDRKCFFVCDPVEFCKRILKIWLSENNLAIVLCGTCALGTTFFQDKQKDVLVRLQRRPTRRLSAERCSKLPSRYFVQSPRTLRSRTSASRNISSMSCLAATEIRDRRRCAQEMLAAWKEDCRGNCRLD